MKHLAIGVCLITLGLWGIFVWWESFGLVMRALVPFALLVVGSVAVLASYSRMGTTASEPDNFANREEESPGEVEAEEQ